MRFEFATAARILFGPGTLREVGPLAKSLGTRAFIITGRNPERAARLRSMLDEHGVAHSSFAVVGEPTVQTVLAGVQAARAERCDVVIAFGGGSAIDAAKAIAALLTNDQDIFDYLEVIGRAKPITIPPLPWIAIPTTAGAGAEVTRNAVLASPQHRVKASLRSPLLLPRLAVVDPELTYELPQSVTASTGLDALTQLLEPFVSIRANPMTDALCREGLARAAHSLRRAYENGADAAAREDMSLASLFGGLALANAALGAVHGFAAPIGGMFPAPHGAVCAVLLPHVMEINLRALRQRAPDSETLRRFQEAAAILTGRPRASADDAVKWVRELCEQFQIPALRSYQIEEAALPEICDKAAIASSMKGNPIALTKEEMLEIVQRAW
jgi:alcohol dehydrogenase class IV